MTAATAARWRRRICGTLRPLTIQSAANCVFGEYGNDQANRPRCHDDIAAGWLVGSGRRSLHWIQPLRLPRYVPKRMNAPTYFEFDTEAYYKTAMKLPQLSQLSQPLESYYAQISGPHDHHAVQVQWPKLQGNTPKVESLHGGPEHSRIRHSCWRLFAHSQRVPRAPRLPWRLPLYALPGLRVAKEESHCSWWHDCQLYS